MPLLYLTVEPISECQIKVYKDYYYIYDSTKAIIHNEITVCNLGEKDINTITAGLPYSMANIEHIAVDPGNCSLKDIGKNCIATLLLAPLEIRPGKELTITFLLNVNNVASIDRSSNIYLPIYFYNLHPFKTMLEHMSLKDCPGLLTNGLDLTVVLPPQFEFGSGVKTENEEYEVRVDNLINPLPAVVFFAKSKCIVNDRKFRWGEGTFLRYTNAQLSQLEDIIKPNVRGRKKIIKYSKIQSINFCGYRIPYTYIATILISIIALFLSVFVYFK